MKPTHRYDTKAYHDYYIHQAGKGYPVFAGRRYCCSRGQYCIGSNTRVIISPSLPSTGTILNNGTWASPTILGSTKGQYTYRKFNPFLTSATQSATYSPAGNILVWILTWIVVKEWWWLDNLFSLSYRFYDWLDWQRYSMITVGIASWITKPGWRFTSTRSHNYKSIWSCYRMVNVLFGQ
jgi:hypothetical protein